MTKYIDAERLKAEIKRQIHMERSSIQSLGDYGQSCNIVALENIVSLITSLQQEDIPETALCATCPNRRNTHAYQDGYDAGRADALKEQKR